LSCLTNHLPTIGLAASKFVEENVMVTVTFVVTTVASSSRALTNYVRNDAYHPTFRNAKRLPSYTASQLLLFFQRSPIHSTSLSPEQCLLHIIRCGVRRSTISAKLMHHSSLSTTNGNRKLVVATRTVLHQRFSLYSTKFFSGLKKKQVFTQSNQRKSFWTSTQSLPQIWRMI